jgi:hypothetical protein
MEAAREFFLPPWKIGGGTRTLWLARFDALREARIKKGQKVQRELDKLRGA